jgi:hypothetical protein
MTPKLKSLFPNRPKATNGGKSVGDSTVQQVKMLQLIMKLAKQLKELYKVQEILKE